MQYTSKNYSTEELQDLVNALSWNDGYGCYTRAGFEKMVWPEIQDKAQYIIFFDIDNMHDLNQEHGYDGVNELINHSLRTRETDYMAGQWFSGDEFIVVITDDRTRLYPCNPVEFASRLAEIFHKNGVPATFAVAQVISTDLYTNVAPAHHKVQEAKSNGRRGTVNVVGGAS